MVPSWRSLLRWKPIRLGNLRRLADYIQPDEIIDLTDVVEPEEEEEAPEVPNGYNCPICLTGLENPVATMCGHIFCIECLTHYLPASYKNCPLCKRYISQYIRLYF